MSRAWKVAGPTVATLVVGCVLFAAFFDWSVLRDLIARVAAARTGRAVAIENLSVQLRWRPTLRATGVRISNPGWATAPNLLEADRIEFTISLPALLRGALVFHDLEVMRPRVALERRDGQRSWVLSPNRGAVELPVVHRLVIADGTVRYQDSASHTSPDLRVETRAKAPEDQMLAAEVSSTFRGQTVHGKAAGPASLADRSQRYPLQGQIAIGATAARFGGAIKGPATFEAVDLEAEMSGTNLADLESMVDFNIPDTPPYKLAGHVSRAGAEWRIDSLRGMVGDTDLVVLDGAAPPISARRPHLEPTGFR